MPWQLRVGILTDTLGLLEFNLDVLLDSGFNTKPITRVIWLSGKASI